MKAYVRHAGYSLAAWAANGLSRLIIWAEILIFFCG